MAKKKVAAEQAGQQQQQEQPKFEEVKCSVAFFNQIVQYLHQQPYAQVKDIIEALQTQFSIIPLEEGPKGKK
jgi:hypothetical protein